MSLSVPPHGDISNAAAFYHFGVKPVITGWITHLTCDKFTGPK
jgi:hypothetical protein